MGDEYMGADEMDVGMIAIEDVVISVDDFRCGRTELLKVCRGAGCRNQW